MSTIALEAPQKRAALAVSLLLHAGLLGLLLLLKIVTPIPPYPEAGGEGMELGIADLGYSLEGQGETESMEESAPSEAQTSTSQPEESAEELISEEDGEPVKTPPVGTENPRSETPVTKPTRKPPKITEPTVNPHALFSSSTSPSDGDGKKPGGDGNDGKPGNVGIPGGNPNGLGVFQGNGWSVRGGRGASRGPDLSEKPNLTNETWVEVAVVIDRDGKVTRTYVSNSATTASDIHNVALRAVKKMQFAANPNGPPEQVQYVRLTFRPS